MATKANISAKARRLTKAIAMTGAFALVAFALAIALFFLNWRYGLISLAVSVLCAAATFICFSMYRNERRKDFVRRSVDEL